jgi:hypothetical protein
MWNNERVTMDEHQYEFQKPFKELGIKICHLPKISKNTNFAKLLTSLPQLKLPIYKKPSKPQFGNIKIGGINVARCVAQKTELNC